MNTVIDVKHKIKAGHTVFSKAVVLALLAEIDRLRALVNQPALPLDAESEPARLKRKLREQVDAALALAPGAEAEATG